MKINSPPRPPTSTLTLALAALACFGCGVDSTGQNTGGTDESGTAECAAGVNIVLSDYLSTQVALTNLEGEVQSESLVSTASTMTDGLAFALSGDVALPSSRTTSGNVVLLDRYGTNVISWVDPKSAEVVAQLPVGTGFESNPQDYLEISESIAVVSRWGQNSAPGSQAYDDGGDLIFIDLKKHEISSSIVIAPQDDLPPRPGSLTLVGEEVLVTLDRIAVDFSKTGDAMIVGVDINREKVAWQQTLKGLKACGKVVLSPDAKTLALACTGALDTAGDTEDLSQSALLLFDAARRPLKELARFKAEDLLGDALQGSVAFADNTHVLLKTQTPWGGKGNNRVFSLDLDTGDTEVLLEARADDDGKGKGIVFAGLSCAPGCSNVCLMADADRGVVQRFQFSEDSGFELLKAVKVEETVGLPPQGISLR